MPIKKSAKKALRQSKGRREDNRKTKKVLKETIKGYRKLIETANKKESIANISLVYKKLDKAAKTNVIKKNKASRLKSRLAKKIAGLK